MTNLRSIYLRTVAVILLITGSAKIFTGTGTTGVLSALDPLLLLTNRQVLYSVGIGETILALCILFRRSHITHLLFTAWLGTIFLLYHVCVFFIGGPKPCSCLGTLGDRLRLSPETVDLLMKSVLAFLLLGSYSFLIAHWLGARNAKSVEEASPTGA